MAYLAPIHQPTSVRNAIRIKLLEPGEECLVVSKANRLEIYRQSQHGLSLEHSRIVYGKILMLEKVPISSCETERLFVGTDRSLYFTVSWDPRHRMLRTESEFVDQVEKSSRDSQSQDRCLIDPLRRYIALLLYNGIVTIIPLISKGKRRVNTSIDKLGDPVPARTADLLVRSCAFLHPREKDKYQVKLATLYEDSHQKVCLSIRALDYAAGPSGEAGSADLENVLAVREDLEIGATHLIPVPAPTYGFLVLAETSISYFDNTDKDPIIQELAQPSQFVAWTSIDHVRWLLGDDYGKLYLLLLIADDSGIVSGWKLDIIGQTSRASSLVYLEDGLVFVGSHQGDSQLVKIQLEDMQIIQSFPNIAPILDFTIMDMGSRSGDGLTNEFSSGQARIVTGSGVFNDGSLRSIRSGVGLDEVGVIGEMPQAQDIFALSSTGDLQYFDVLLVSFIRGSRVFLFDSDGMVEERAEWKSIVLSEPTLFARSLTNKKLLQVTSSQVRIIDQESEMVIHSWSDEQNMKITAADSNLNHLVLALDGLSIATFSINTDLKLMARSDEAANGQISCIHVPDIDDQNCFVGFWQDAKVATLNVKTLEVLSTLQITADAQVAPRSILLADIFLDQSPTLIVSLASGEVATFETRKGSPLPATKKMTILGTQQVNLKRIPRDGQTSTVFATCEHSSLIYGHEDRIVFSAVTAEQATCIASFNSQAFPGAIAILTAGDIRIAMVDPERMTHVQTLHIGELVRRIAYSSSMKAFAIGTIHRRLDGLQEVVQSRLKLADEVRFKELDTYDLNEEELVESVIRAELDDGAGSLEERFIVGTTYSDDDNGDSVRGRILVFAMSVERKLKLITELSVKGACRALGFLDGKIVAALVKTIVIYALRSNHLEKLCTYRTATAPIDIAIHPPTGQIAVADLMKSVSIVTYAPPKDTETEHRLIETGRHFQTAWTTAVAYVAEDTWLETDAEGNVVVLAQDTSALSADAKRRLRTTSEIQLGEMVNRIRPINIKAAPDAPVVPKAFMATVEGGVYLFGLIGKDYLDLLMRLQSSIASLVDSLGHMPFMQYRAFRNSVRQEAEPDRFVDGELIDRFLDLQKDMQTKVVAGLGELAEQHGGFEGIMGLVENLKRLH